MTSPFDVVPPEDRPALMLAFSHHCTCQFDGFGKLVGAACESCVTLTDKGNLKHLVFARRLKRMLLDEEFRVQDPVAA